MGHAILNRLIGLVNKTLKVIFFSRKLSFHSLSWVLDQWRPKKRTSLKEDSNWLDILQPCYNNSHQISLKLSRLSRPPDCNYCRHCHCHGGLMIYSHCQTFPPAAVNHGRGKYFPGVCSSDLWQLDWRIRPGRAEAGEIKMDFIKVTIFLAKPKTFPNVQLPGDFLYQAT